MESQDRVETCEAETQTAVDEEAATADATNLQNLHIPVPSPNSSLSPDITHRTSGTVSFI